MKKLANELKKYFSKELQKWQIKTILKFQLSLVTTAVIKNTNTKVWGGCRKKELIHCFGENVN
jgi:hypothetical protein